MKTQLLILLFCLTTIGLAGQPPVPNGAFETWIKGIPENWITNATVGPGIIEEVPGVTGSALSGTVTGIEGVSFNVGPSITSSEGLESGFAVDGNYPFVSFDYKFSPVNGDVALVSVTLFNDDFMSTGSGFFYLEDPVDAFTHVQIPITYDSPGSTRMQINATISNFNTGFPNVGSNYVLDNFAIDNGPLLVDESSISGFNIHSVFPNPATDVVNLSYSSSISEFVGIKIFDLSGKLVKDASIQTSIGRQSFSIELLGLNAGMYLLQVQSKNGLSSRRLRIIR